MVMGSWKRGAKYSRARAGCNGYFHAPPAAPEAPRLIFSRAVPTRPPVAFPLPRRGSVHQPRVARYELPWVSSHDGINAESVASAPHLAPLIFLKGGVSSASRRLPATSKIFRPSAQGCDVRATLGFLARCDQR